MEWPLIRPPYDVQVAALEKGWDREGFNFYMEQGLGKSATTLANYMLLRKRGDVRKLLVCSPNSFKMEWVDEVKKAGIRVPVVVYQADRPKPFLQTVREEKEWIAIINPESLGKLADMFTPLLTGSDVMMAMDESIKLKNHKSIQSKAARWLGEHCSATRNLSGKPITQGPHDLWAQLVFTRRVKRMNFFAFRNHFCRMGGYMGKKVMGVQNAEELNLLLQSCSMLARKKDWTDLPDKLPPVTVPVAMVGRQLNLYKEMEALFLATLRDAIGGRVTVEQIITRDIKLRQIMSGFLIDNDGVVEELIPFKDNPRFKAMLEILDEQIVGKTVIVTWYKHTMEMMCRELATLGMQPAYIRGSMKPEEVQEQKRRFNEDDECQVMVVQQVAAKYGHTLLGTERNPCSSMIYFEQSWSLDDRSQIEDRIHRFGQKWPCSYFDFEMGKLDKAVVSALQRKEDVAATVLGYALGEPLARAEELDDEITYLA